MASKVRDKLKRSNDDKEGKADNSVEDVFSYNRSKKRKLA